MTIASTPARSSTAQSATALPASTHQQARSYRKEVTTMMQKLQAVLRLGRRPAPRHSNPFDGQFLDQRREDVYVEMHQLGFVR